MRDNRGGPSYTLKGDLQGQKIGMGIHVGAMAHIMRILTDLYSNPPLAVIREYSTNARDSHIAAGVTRPIEVTLPSGLSPFLTIRDYGVGLSRQDIEEIYSQYGASTKRDSDDFNGMLGLGCKSALTYCDQFVVTGVKDGMRAQVSVSRDEAGGGSMTIVDESPTDDPSGVTITIPSSVSDGMDRHAQNFFQFWEKGTVLVNGEEPECVRDTALRLSDDLYLVKGYDTNHIVMGGVAYPFDMVVSIARGYYLVAFVEMGEVAFTPSREALHMTEQTKATIDRVVEEAHEGLMRAIQSEIDSAPTKPEALRALYEWRDAAPRASASDFTYQGRAIPRSYTVPKARVLVPASWDPKKMLDSWNPDVKGIVNVYRYSYTLSEHSKSYSVSLQSLATDAAVVVYGYDRKRWSAAMKRKLEKWTTDAGLTGAIRYYLMDHRPDFDGWVEPRMVDWQEINSIRLPPRYTPGGGGPYAGRVRPSGSYDTFIDGVYTENVLASDIDTNKAIYYFNGNERETRPYAKLLTRFEPSHTLVFMPLNRIRKFERDFPRAEEVRDAISDFYEQWKDGLGDGRRYALSLHSYDNLLYKLKFIEPSKVDDPVLRRAAQWSRRDISDDLETRILFYSLIGKKPDESEFRDINPFRAYPLFDRMVHVTNPDHSYMYLNAAYAAR